MVISKRGLELIKSFEGCRLSAYRDSVGVLTIGYGHTRGVTEGMVITQERAEELLLEDIDRYERNVMSWNYIYNWTQNEFDALVSFAFNVGNIDGLTYNGIRSKKMIADKMLEYCKAGGKRISGLVTRRQREREMFLGVDNVDNSVDNSEATLINSEIHSLNRRD